MENNNNPIIFPPTVDNRCPYCKSFLNREGNVRICSRYYNKYCTYKWFD